MAISKADAIETDKIRAFLAMYRGSLIQSTRAQIVDFKDDLYNVTGSTPDPKAIPGFKGYSWTALLKSYPEFSGCNCYVTSPLVGANSSHPGFDVGGHMTPNSDGIVDKGAVSYLMPLCKWHNNPTRNGIAFKHTKTKMLELSGFMQGDVPLTFALRLDDTPKLLFLEPNSKRWDFKMLGVGNKGINKSSIKSALLDSQEYALFERRGDSFFIASTNINEVV